MEKMQIGKSLPHQFIFDATNGYMCVCSVFSTNSTIRFSISLPFVHFLCICWFSVYFSLVRHFFRLFPLLHFFSYIFICFFDEMHGTISTVWMPNAGSFRWQILFTQLNERADVMVGECKKWRIVFDPYANSFDSKVNTTLAVDELILVSTFNHIIDCVAHV